MIELRRVECDTDLETWAAIKTTVMPDEPVTADELRRAETEERLLVLAAQDGATLGCGIASPSSFPRACFVGPRVLADARGRGVGEALLRRPPLTAKRSDASGLWPTPMPEMLAPAASRSASASSRSTAR